MVYHNIKVNLTKHQQEKIAHAVKHNTDCTIRIGMNSGGSHSLQVTERQHNKLMKGGQHDIKISKEHIHHLIK